MPVADTNTFPKGVGVMRDNNSGNGAAVDEKTKLDPSDPRVKKLVYNMYRDMLTNYKNDADQFISQQDPSQVSVDYGVNPIIQTIIRGQSGSSSASGGGESVADAPSSTGVMSPAPPPPPPMAPPGALPSIRLNTELSHNKGPPMALAGAMMKDKKPFTYTPGGIDLSEIRSPRMAKRLQMNAAAEGVTSTPSPHNHPHAPPSGQPMPPAAMAAMQPQMAIPVFPQGPFTPSTLHRTNKPQDFTDGGQISEKSNGNGTKVPPPPPPPPSSMPPQSQQHLQQPIQNIRPLSPNLQKEISEKLQQRANANSNGMAQRPVSPRNEEPPPPPERNMSASMSPVPPLINERPHQHIRGNMSPDIGTNNTGRSSPASPRVTSPPPPVHNVGTGSIYIPPLSPPVPQQIPPARSTPSPRPGQTKAQVAAQNLGSIYIPPVEQRPSVFSLQSGPSTASSAGSMPTPPTRAQIQTPQLNKAPTPWMNSYNKMASQQAESPPYVHPQNMTTPWGTLGGPPTPPAPGVIRTIPISIEGKGAPPQPQPTQPDERANAAQRLGRVIPIQIQRQASLNQEQQMHMQQAQAQQLQMQQAHAQAQSQQGWPRTIPIQVEGRTTPRAMAPPSGYNNPMGLYSQQNAAQAYQQQLMSGMRNMSLGNESPHSEPTQSKSLRVIGKAAENVDEDSSLQQKTTEPRFRGGHIPSKAFKTLQTTLPPKISDAQIPPPPPQSQSFSSQGGPTMQNIPMRTMPQSPTPQQQPQQYVPPSEQQVQEPKKYMGGNIPSRSFKMLQAMTAGDDPQANGAAAELLDDSGLLCDPFDPSPSLSTCSSSSDASLPSTPYDPNYDPYYTWYYWWFYVSHYWAGYDMSGYEYPQGWDPNEPYFPPELMYDYNNYDYLNQGTDPEDTDFETSYKNVPKIVIEGEGQVNSDKLNDRKSEMEDDSHRKDNVESCKGGDCDSSADEESYWSCAEDNSNQAKEQKVISTETVGEDKCELRNSDDDEDDETEGEDGGEGDEADSRVIVEEPETPGSDENLDDSVSMSIPNSNVFIEEYLSSESDLEFKKGRLSTISERTEDFSTKSGIIEDQEKVDEEDYESESDSSSSEEVSSVSVIENKSATESNSKREDGTTSDSEDDYDDPDNDVNNAVTVRLPLKLSFGKTKSYKDITTVLVCDEEKIKKDVPQEPEPVVEEIKHSVLLVTEDCCDEDDDEEPVVSFTISLSRQHSKEEEHLAVDQTETEEEVEIDFWSAIMAPEDDGSKNIVKLNKEEKVVDTFTPIDDFWGSTTEPDEASTITGSYSWDTEFNFWDKSVTTIEARRFSNFEISEDYESDTGMKSDSGERLRGHKPRVKRYTHTQKRHSVPGLPVWTMKDKKKEKGEPLKVVEDSALEPENNFWSWHSEVVQACEGEEVEESQLIPQEMEVNDQEQKVEDFSAGWSYWDDIKDNECNKIETSAIEPKETETEDVWDEEEDPEVFEPESKYEVQEPESYQEQLEEREVVDQTSQEQKRISQLSETSDVMTSDIEEGLPDVSYAPLSEPISSSKQLPVGEENSDESSKSSGTTIRQPQSTLIQSDQSEKENKAVHDDEPIIQNSEVRLRNISIKEIPEHMKLSESSSSEQLGPHNHSPSCTCHLGDRMARAESLLWRIERFLHESLSLGSEDDSGVMTDLSRQISDVDTDADENAELLLANAAAISAKDRRSNNPSKSQISPKSPVPILRQRPKSEILIESSKILESVDTSDVKMRTTSAERKALRYQRAKTHSRLFQLLQDECGKDEDDEECDGGDEDEFHDCELLPKTPLSFNKESFSSVSPIPCNNSTDLSTKTPLNEPINIDVRRSRLLPLPLKNLLGSTSGANSETNSSPSGSSGVLSPTSPVSKDQLLADIINEFHIRHQSELSESRRVRFSRFPSKVFKLLQQEFGEEFYETFDCCGDFGNGIGDLLTFSTTSTTTTTTTGGSETCQAHSMINSGGNKTIRKSLSRDDSKQSTPDFLEVPVRRKRDFRSPKPGNKSLNNSLI